MNLHQEFLRHGDVVTYRVPDGYTGVIPFNQREGRAVVLSPEGALRKNPNDMIIAFIDPKSNGDKSICHDVVQGVGQKYWNVQKSVPAERLSDRLLSTTIKNFLDLVYPTEDKFDIVSASNMICYGHTYLYRLAYCNADGDKPRPVLAISFANTQGIALALKHTTSRSDPIYHCPIPYAGDANCGNIFLIDTKKVGRLIGSLDQPRMHDVAQTLMGKLDDRVFGANLRSWGARACTPREQLVARGMEGRLASATM